jgi:hypothetical protein
VAEGELVSLPGRGVVAEAWLCGVVRGRRDSAASCCRADHGSRAEGAAVGAPSRLGRCVACLDFAGAQALAAPRDLANCTATKDGLGSERSAWRRARCPVHLGNRIAPMLCTSVTGQSRFTSVRQRTSRRLRCSSALGPEADIDLKVRQFTRQKTMDRKSEIRELRSHG